jgi:hypothetical protein
MPISDPYSVVVHVPEALGQLYNEHRCDGIGFATIESAGRFRHQFAPIIADDPRGQTSRDARRQATAP